MTDAEVQARIQREAVLALGQWVSGAKIWNKRLCDLTEFQITCMVETALSQAIVERSRIQKELGEVTAESPWLFAL